MVIEYLTDYLQELLGRRIDLQEELQRSETSIRENKEFIRMIEESEDKSYESFSPRNYKNDRNEKKIKELKDQQQQLRETSMSLKQELERLNRRIEELENLIRAEKKKENLKYVELKKQEANEKIYELAVQQLTSVMNKIETCERIVEVDRYRCKMELRNLAGIVKGIIEELNKYEM